MELPRDMDAVLKRLLEPARESVEQCSLLAEDEAYLRSLLAAVREGHRAVLIVEDVDQRLRYMFSNATRAEAVTMLGKIVEATGRRLAENEE